MIGRQCSTFIMLVGEEHQQGLDYKPVNTSLTTADERDGLWTQLNEVNGHTGLFNGNISWMITDLTYDPNGNILTLQRKNEAGSVADDFDYVYYTNTNRLREVVPVTKDKVYSSGPVRTDDIVYRNVTINGSAYAPQGSNVEVKALENILMDPAFESPDGTDFWAHILGDDGTYQYDAIGISPDKLKFTTYDDYLKFENDVDKFGLLQSEKIFLSLDFDYKLDLFLISQFDASLYISDKLKSTLINEGITGIEIEDAIELICQ